jgi:two-component system, LytTR family, sensor kinase
MTSTATKSFSSRHPILSLQFVVWLLLLVMLSVPTVLSGAARVASATWILTWATVGIALTGVWSKILERLPESSLRAPGIAWLLPVSIAGGLVWMGVLWMLEPWLGIEPALPPEAPAHAVGVVRGTVILLVWTGLYLITLLTKRMQRERERVLAAEGQASAAQLQSLRSQLNPHFLFNALNSVVGLIIENPKGAQTMVRDLSALLRQALGRTHNTGTLADEFAFNALYLKCEKVRFEERLQIEVTIAPGLDTVETPTMLLQPLVENALKHGRSSANAPLILQVRANANGHGVEVLVQNPGTLTPGAEDGLGLRSVKERLRTLYGLRQSFSLTESGGVVCARVSWPLKRVQP